MVKDEEEHEKEHMLADVEEPQSTQQQRTRTQEWIPTWLRKTRTLPVALYCVVFAVLLEALDLTVRRKNGLTADSEHTSSVNAARYIPTVGIVVLGFACKSIASDAKKVTPWSTMSCRWTKSSNSVALDYVNSIEAFTVVPSLRRRHWAVFTGLVVGLICGALVAVANSLTYINLFASSTRDATFNKATTFDFDETLEMANNSLAIPYTSQGQQPYAAVVSQGLTNGQAGAWTLDNYVFESFTNTTQMPKNGTMEAQVKAIFPNWSCHLIDLIASTPPEIENLLLTARTSEQPELNCGRDTFMDTMERWIWAEQPETGLGWLNVTACGEDEEDLRLVSTLARGINTTQEGDSEVTFDTAYLSAMCWSNFTIQDATIRVNQSTGEVLNYTLGSSPPTPIDIHTSTTAQYIYLNNPLDGRSQDVYSTSDRGVITNVEPVANLDTITEAADNFLATYYNDPFTLSMADGDILSSMESFLNDPNKFASAVEQQANTVMSQITSFLARANTTGTFEGQIRTDGPKLFLRQASLRALQAFLVVIAAGCVFQSTFFRPKTILYEDPGSIAARAVILASSPERIERIFAREAVSSEKDMQRELRPKKWSLQPNPNGSVMLQAAKQEGPDDRKKKPSRFARLFKIFKSKNKENKGFRPLALQAWAKWGIVAATLVVMAALAALMALSRIHHGICANTAAASAAFAFVPTVVLVILGYAWSGIDTAVRVIAPYKNLRNGYSAKKQPLFSTFGDGLSTLAPIHAFRNRLGLTIGALSFVVLFIPAIKIVAAGLYNVELVQRSQNIDPLVDTSFVNYLEEAFDSGIDIEASIQTASQFTEWTMYPDWNIPVQAGILDNLVFSNLISVDASNAQGTNLSSDSEITVNVPAIAVDVTCKNLDVGVSAWRTNCTDGNPESAYFDFYAHCNTAACNSTMNITSDSLHKTFNVVNRGSFSSACKDEETRYKGMTFLRYDLGYQVTLGDLGPAQGYITNTTYWGSPNEYGSLPTISVTADMFNISSLPIIMAEVCYSNFSQISVDTTYSRTSASSSSSSSSSSSNSSESWNPIRYDARSIRTTRQIDNVPYWLAPLAKTKATDSYNQYDASTDTPGLLDSDSLWPTRASSTSFFELLASYANNNAATGGNLSKLLEKDFFAQASAAIYTSYATNMLTELRPWALNASGLSSSDTLPAPDAAAVVAGTLAFPQARIHQDLASTIALEVLLALMLLTFVWVALRFPNDAVLPKNPGSIAGTASLVAGSRLVARLRSEGAGSAKEAGAWVRGHAALGWWPTAAAAAAAGAGAGAGAGEEEKEGTANSSGSESETAGERSGKEADRVAEEEVDRDEQKDMRWGIDVGEGVVPGSWEESEEVKRTRGQEGGVV